MHHSIWIIPQWEHSKFIWLFSLTLLMTLPLNFCRESSHDEQWHHCDLPKVILWGFGRFLRSSNYFQIDYILLNKKYFINISFLVIKPIRIFLVFIEIAINPLWQAICIICLVCKYCSNTICTNFIYKRTRVFVLCYIFKHCLEMLKFFIFVYRYWIKIFILFETFCMINMICNKKETVQG